VLLFVILQSRYFQQSHPIPTYKQGLKWCCLCDYMLEYISTVLPTPPMKDSGCAALWLHVLEYFQQSYPTPPMKQGLKWCAALCDYMC
jgi:hypothetical protein